ncbi:pseudouridine synthase [Thermosediminibacter oceani]|uniref:Pseudouridine synthase n=1 Tax=Thermosediminibacter oceani (strain ATCC BAA-1034 / DSM 16646 / JW/IW-1228P) TaxID=555079 RepID=D9S1Y2_THEOJ|nr:pseudouridine synthase [Thermosediminibacter oceani]ADL07409.1 ribosomal small subunit pseudouridine synthase A [Thermosediminibacter oceani DSM 16646]
MAEKTERLDKVLSMAGYGSRKDVKKIIKRGEVEVNGRVVTDAGTPVAPAVDSISVSGELLIFKEHIYIMMNKPQGVISATHDRRETTVIDLLEDEFSHRNLFPVGRLDKDAEGLLLLTDDGQLAHRLLSPRKKVEKVYYVEVKGRLVEEDVKAFKEGVFLGDYRALPAKLEILEAGEVSSALVTIYEGKFHQIKRMMKARGKEVTYLKRLSMGPLKLDENLEPGEWRELTDEEIRILTEAVNL